MENKKVTRKDLTVVKGKIEVDTLIIDSKKINLTPIPHTNIESYITHRDCEECGVEFQKQYTYDRFCNDCSNKIRKDKYMKLELVEWNGEDALNIYNDDQYFFDLEEVLEYCDENEIELKNLQLVTTYRTSFSPIDWETIEQDQTHEDWEPSDEFKSKVDEFNKWLTSQSTSTWMPTNKRVDISKYLTQK
jgi:hypothetical protein